MTTPLSSAYWSCQAGRGVTHQESRKQRKKGAETTTVQQHNT